MRPRLDEKQLYSQLEPIPIFSWSAVVSLIQCRRATRDVSYKSAALLGNIEENGLPIALFYMVETGESLTPRPEGTPVKYPTGFSGNLFSLPQSSTGGILEAIADNLRLPNSACEQLHPGFMAPDSLPSGRVGADVAA